MLLPPAPKPAQTSSTTAAKAHCGKWVGGQDGYSALHPIPCRSGCKWPWCQYCAGTVPMRNWLGEGRAEMDTRSRGVFTLHSPAWPQLWQSGVVQGAPLLPQAFRGSQQAHPRFSGCMLLIEVSIDSPMLFLQKRSHGEV